jgi:hypothetical protein
MTTIIDIETTGLPADKIAHLAPEFTAPANYKDADKIAANIAEQRTEWLKRAALSPLTGKIVAIGFKEPNAKPLILTDNESYMLRYFWERYNKDADAKFIGHNILGFDLPFIIRRSWALGVKVPPTVNSGRYLNDRRFLDTMTTFQCGNRTEKFFGLDTVARFMGFAGKTEKIGADWFAIFQSDPERALDYLKADLQAVEDIALRMGLISTQ